MRLESNVFMVERVLERNSLMCDSLPLELLRDRIFCTEQVEHAVGWALSRHALSAELARYRGERLLLSEADLRAAFEQLAAQLHDGVSVRTIVTSAACCGVVVRCRETLRRGEFMLGRLALCSTRRGC
jgi:hypothetical protein